jgi:ABC-type branched-subunit amino acid transport system ATPase component
VQSGDNVENIFGLTIREVLRFAALLKRTDQKSFAYCSTKFKKFKKHNSSSNNNNNNNYSSSSNSNKNKRVEKINEIELIGKNSDVEDRIEHVIEMLNFNDVADFTIVENMHDYFYFTNNKKNNDNKKNENNNNEKDNENKIIKLSPSQLRVLTIGVELVNKPSLIFLENPFLNLNFFDMCVVMNVIKSLSLGGRSIVCNVVKTVDRIFKMFDELLLLSSGFLVYGGLVKDVDKYFENIGFFYLFIVLYFMCCLYCMTIFNYYHGYY